MTYNEAIQNCKKDQKIIYGTQSKTFHIIESTDRDYDTRFAVDREEAIRLGEIETAIKSING